LPRLEDSIGSIEVGKRADIILMDFDAPHLSPTSTVDLSSHIVYSSCGADVSTVIIDGRVVMDERKIVGVDEEEIMLEVGQAGLASCGRRIVLLDARESVAGKCCAGIASQILCWNWLLPRAQPYSARICANKLWL